jgi:hypothetical protein
MRWERADEPVTWTTIDNAIIDDDLSCRALGLLTRWLRRPPGSELDSIPDMIKRAKRSGKGRIEGRDALYAASYELEAAGYLVRESAVNELGQHEWVVRIYARPVDSDKRSNPEDRKRGTRRAPSEKPQVSPITGFQESGSQKSGDPDSGDPDSVDQGFSLKDSVNDSLSGHSRPSSDAPEGTREREAAAPGSAGADAGARPAGRGDAQAVVDAYEAAAGRRLAASMQARLRAQARELLAAGDSVEWLKARAAEMPAHGWLDLAMHCEMNRRRPVPVVPGQAGGRRGEPDPEKAAAMAAILARGSGL